MSYNDKWLYCVSVHCVIVNCVTTKDISTYFKIISMTISSGNLRRFRRLCELIQVQVCSRRPPPASPRASRKFASSELRDSESGGSDISDKSSLLAGDERRIGTPSSRGKTACPTKKPAAATLSAPTAVVTSVAAAGAATSPSAISNAATSRRTTPKSPSNPLVHSIAEEVLEAQQTNNQQQQLLLHDATEVEGGGGSNSAAKLDKSSNLLVHDDNLEKMNVQNGLSPDQRENGNPPASIVMPISEITDDSTTSKSSPDNNAKLASKSKGKSTRGDSTDALLSGDEDKSPSNDENNPSTMME